MRLPWLRQSSQADSIEAIYGAIVAQARIPAFYADFGVPDTVDGRFDMLVLHLFLFLHRLGGQTGPHSGIGQGIFDRFCRDLDANLREMGVGDLTVPRKMQHFAEAYYGRSAVYERALANADHNAATLAIARNIFGQDFPRSGSQRLSDYMFSAAAALAAISEVALTRGNFTFPNPAPLEGAADSPP